jgi:thymidylate synthase (FAD)
MVEFSSEFEVEFIQGTGTDAIVAAAARVSTGLNLDEYSAEDNAKLISYLMKHRHGSPFEHGSMTFRISAPIFVFREFMRHRIGWSYNETSARYKKLEPKFYVYPGERPLIQEGSSAHPNLVAGTPHMTENVNGRLELLYGDAWNAYTSMIEDGVAYEVARAVLPVGIYSEMYVTCNPRSLMAFLSLRVDAENARFETKPQWEIEQVAKNMEEYFALLYPATYDAFNNHGRVAP